MGTTELQLTERGRQKYLAWLKLKKLTCARCGGEIHPGDQIHRSGRIYFFRNPWELKGKPGSDARFWHLSCYEELFVDV